MEKKVLSIKEACEVLGIGRSSFVKLVANGTIASIRLGRRILIPVVALDRIIDGATTLSNETKTA